MLPWRGFAMSFVTPHPDATPSRFRIRGWPGSFEEPGTEREFLAWSFERDRRFYRRVAIVAAIIMTAYAVTDVAHAGTSFVALSSILVRILSAGICLLLWHRLSGATTPAHLTRLALTFSATILVTFTILLGHVHFGVPETVGHRTIEIGQLTVLLAPYLLLHHGIALQSLLGTLAIVVWPAIPWLSGTGTAGFTLTLFFHLAMANTVGILVAVQGCRQRREAFSGLVTERELNERLREENQRRRSLEEERLRFFSILGHDLRSPLATLIALIEILAEESATLSREQIRERATAATRNARSLLALLSRLLQWGRLHAGQVPFEPKVVDLDEEIERAVDVLRPGAKEKAVGITVHPSGLSVRVDPRMLETVLRNLVGNAIKFTETGGRVDVRATPRGDEVGIRVSDDGIGIPAERLASLFDVGSLHSSAGTHGETGSGFGLLLCREMIERHGGRIRVESEPGRGTSIEVTLPRSEVEGTFERSDSPGSRGELDRSPGQLPGAPDRV